MGMSTDYAIGARPTETPAARLLGQWNPDHPDWTNARARRLGGSEIAAALGLSPWESRFSLWHRKQGMIGGQFENRGMSWGKKLEPLVLGEFFNNHPDLLRAPAGIFVNNDRDWQLASPDALACQTGDLVYQPTVLVEAKTADSSDYWQWGQDGTDEIPVYYACQVQWYLDVLGLKLAYVAVLIGGNDYREYRIEANPDDQATLRAAGEEFIRSIREQQRPDLDAHSATYLAVKELHPQIEDRDVDLEPELARDFCNAQNALRAAKKRAQLVTVQVADVMGDAQRAKFGETVIARRQAKGTGTPFVVAGRNLPNYPEDPTP